MKQLLSVSSSVRATHQVEFSKGRFSKAEGGAACCFTPRVAALWDTSLHKS